MRLPHDANEVERELYSLLTTGDHVNSITANVYKKLDDPTDKFLVAYVFELGHTRKLAGEVLGLSKVTIWSKIKRIKRTLRECYKI